MMADLPQQKFYHKADNGEERKIVSKVTVTQDGIFHMTVPDDLVDSIRANLGSCHIDEVRRRVKKESMLPSGLQRHETRITNRVSGSSLDDCKRAIKAGLRDWLKCEVTEELVIRYGKQTKTTYWKMPDDAIYANGGDCENDPNYDHERDRDDDLENGTWFGELDTTHHNAGYMVSLFASIKKKTIYTRGSVVEHKYSRPDFDNFSHKTWGERLNCFVGIWEAGGFMEDGIECEEMPYTEEAAKFFYEMLIGMCAFADKIEAFFAEPDNVMKAIESGAVLLIGRDS